MEIKEYKSPSPLFVSHFMPQQSWYAMCWVLFIYFSILNLGYFIRKVKQILLHVVIGV